jgi:hypothetical protein
MRKSSKSFKNNENRKGHKFSPCRTLFHMENIQIYFHMKVNVDKTKIVAFSKGRLPRNLIFNYNETNIEIVKEFNYLGIFFSRTE